MPTPQHRLQVTSFFITGLATAGLLGASFAAPAILKPPVVKAPPVKVPAKPAPVKPASVPRAITKSPVLDETTSMADVPAGIKRALVIGVEKYDNLAPLNHSCDDARAFASLLQTNYGFKSNSVVLVTDDSEAKGTKPTFLALKGLINNWVASIRPGDEVVFFFSGHGANVSGDDRLLPNDVTKEQLGEYSIDYKDLRNDLENKNPFHCIMITDACRNIVGGAKGTDEDNEYGMIEKSNDPQFAELRSCRPHQVSLEMQDKPYGAFTFYLLKGLRDDPEAVDSVKNAVTFDSLTKYLELNVGNYAVKCNRPTQTPTGTASQGSMVFRRPKAEKVITPVNDETLSMNEKPELGDKVELVVQNAPPGTRLFLGNEEEDDLSQPLLLDIAAAERTVTATAEARGFKRLKSGVTFKRGFSTVWNLQMEPDLSSSVPGERTTTPDGAIMVWVSPGLFWMGSGDHEGQENERPLRKVNIPKGFWIDKTEVSVAQFRAFCKANNDLMPPAPSWGWRNDDPMVNVTFDEARAYAKWAGKRLPTEAEWERAARGDEANPYPWGKEFSSDKAVIRVPGIRRNTPAYVGSMPAGASPCGAMDMTGNVLEWCSDWFYDRYYFYCENKPHSKILDPVGSIITAIRKGKAKPLGFSDVDPQGPERVQSISDTQQVECTQHVLRGGFWATEQDDARVTTRFASNPKARLETVGFRCVQDKEGPSAGAATSGANAPAANAGDDKK